MRGKRREREEEIKKKERKRRGGRGLLPDPSGAVSNLDRLAPELTANSICR